MGSNDIIAYYICTDRYTVNIDIRTIGKMWLV